MQRPRFTICTLTALSLSLACGSGGDGAPGSTDDPATTSDASSSTSASSSAATTAAESTGGTNPESTEGSGAGSSSSNGSSEGPADTSSDTGAPSCPDVGDPCTQCEATMCPQEYCDCYNNGSCVLLAQCTLECAIDDLACNQACWTQYPDGISDGALLTHCAATVCMPQCGPFVALTECQQCLYGRCPEEMNVCVSNPDCTALLACLDACEIPGCENGCYALYPDGLADSGPVGECAQDACTGECV